MLQERLIEELKAAGLTDEQVKVMVARARAKVDVAEAVQRFAEAISKLVGSKVDVSMALWAKENDEGEVVGYTGWVKVKIEHYELGSIVIDEGIEVTRVSSKSGNTDNGNNGGRDGNTNHCIELVSQWARQFGIALPEKWREYANVMACRLAKRLVKQGKLNINDPDVQWLQATYAKTWDNV